MKKAIDLIAEERQRQIEKGYTPEHDDQHSDGELATAASVYADYANYTAKLQIVHSNDTMEVYIPRNFKWPFSKEAYKPTPDDRIRELAKAAALIVAEIERLQRREIK